jgi:hypothetical protein
MNAKRKTENGRHDERKEEKERKEGVGDENKERTNFHGICQLLELFKHK